MHVIRHEAQELLIVDQRQELVGQVERNAELVLALASSDVLMRVGIDIGIEPQCNPCRPAQFLR